MQRAYGMAAATSRNFPVDRGARVVGSQIGSLRVGDGFSCGVVSTKDIPEFWTAFWLPLADCFRAADIIGL